MMIPAELRKFGLEAPTTPKFRRLVVTSVGATGTGKSDFFLRTAPRPMLFVNFDRNIEGIEERYEGEDILIRTVRPGLIVNQEKDAVLYKEIRDLILTSIEKRYFRSIGVDTGDAMYELLRRAEFGKLEQVPQHLYTNVNSNMRRYFQAAKDQRVNFYMSHKLGDEYKEHFDAKSGKKVSVATGNKKRKGWGDAEYECQCYVQFDKDKSYDQSSIDKFTMTIIKCTANTTVEGTVFRGEEISWPNLGTTVFPASKWSEWE